MKELGKIFGRLTWGEILLLSLPVVALIVLFTIILSESRTERIIQLTPFQKIDMFYSQPENECDRYELGVKRTNILLLQSYQPTFRWSENLKIGFMGAMCRKIKNLHVNIEYMHSRQFPSQIRSEAYIRSLREKYFDSNIDLVVTADNNAFEFIKDNRSTIFGRDVPFIFCGVNGYSPESIEGVSNVTGVAENYDAIGTIKAAIVLDPNVNKVYVVNDKTNTGRAIRAEIIEQFKELPDTITYEFLEDYSIAGIGQKVSGLEPESIVFMLTWNIDNEGELIRYREAASYLAQRSSVPVYGVWGFILGPGTMGGSLMTGFSQGEAAADLAYRVLQGELPDEIPVIEESQNQYIFDYAAMKRFGIDKDRLPEGSIVLNYPVSILQTHRKPITVLIALFLFMAVIIFLLIMNIDSRRKAQLQLASNQVKFKSYLVELAAKNEELESIIYASYHDLRSPIVNINGFVHELSNSCLRLRDIFKDSQISQEVKSELAEVIEKQIPAHIGIITDNAEKISRLQESLLEVSTIGQEELDKQVIDMNELVYNTLDTIPEIRDGIVDVYVQTLPECYASEPLMERVLHNIIDNAVRFLSDQRKGEITIYGKKEADSVLFSIEDNGVGIDEKNYSDIFRLFYQLRPDPSKLSMGVGLTVAKRIITRHDGEITVKSNLGKGSIFTIRLPIRPAV